MGRVKSKRKAERENTLPYMRSEFAGNKKVTIKTY